MMTEYDKSNRKHCTIVCPKCRRETSFNMPSDAIDEQGEIYRCQHCGWPFQYGYRNKGRPTKDLKIREKLNQKIRVK